jgi:hypothetical protein
MLVECPVTNIADLPRTNALPGANRMRFQIWLEYLWEEGEYFKLQDRSRHANILAERRSLGKACRG